MRMNLAEVAPEVYRALAQLDGYARERIDPTLAELVNLRASVLNNCAFCVDLHSSDALKRGESAQRLFAVAVWRESRFFTDTERDALEFTDAVTRLGEHGVPDELWERVTATFDQPQVAGLLAQIIAINGFNRIGVPLESATERRLR
ncbi:carboxymuconolactone decarboxylase family protein [Actinosynnema sp. NPDC023587]|uniref:carboxymuconolactone decarboxylase family protein n=1 Tax=Actinosynnema sp. NPDC023587 TaxID=3154695 RepID=UPI0033C15FAD